MKTAALARQLLIPPLSPFDIRLNFHIHHFWVISPCLLFSSALFTTFVLVRKQLVRMQSFRWMCPVSTQHLTASTIRLVDKKNTTTCHKEVQYMWHSYSRLRTSFQYALYLRTHRSVWEYTATQEKITGQSVPPKLSFSTQPFIHRSNLLLHCALPWHRFCGLFFGCHLMPLSSLI